MSAVTLAMPCRGDEPGGIETLRRARSAWEAAGLGPWRAVVCVNGAGEETNDAVIAWARGAGDVVACVDVDGRRTPDAPVQEAPSTVTLRTRRAGKANAWNHLRHAVVTPTVIFMDADVAVDAATLASLVSTLAARPAATLASARTQCAPRTGWLEALQAVPYRVAFPNLSPQLYAARTAALPAGMPDDLLEPERWLELVIGWQRIVHAPDARVVVRLPATLADFFRQRIRIEQAKVQLAADHPGLAARGAPQPGLRAALRQLDRGDMARLAAYLGLRTAAHALGWWRQRRGRVEVSWRQASSTKRWGPA